MSKPAAYIGYTVEIFKKDRRCISGERRIFVSDYATDNLPTLKNSLRHAWPVNKGYRWEIFETYVRQKNMMTGEFFWERYDTPYYASASSESYWSN